MSIWDVAKVEQEPSITLTQWQIKKCVDGNYFSGWNIAGEGRASTRIVTYDEEAKRGVTKSGRVYQLEGEAGLNKEAEYVWNRYAYINGLEEIQGE